MTEIELAYAAGLFDGEGCVSINKVRQKHYVRDGYQLRCSISITHEETSLWFKDHFGGSHKPIIRANARNYWQWVVVARKARKFLEEIEPYLVIKKEVAGHGILFQKARDDSQAYNRSEENWNKETELYVAVRKCNARWGTEYYVE